MVWLYAIGSVILVSLISLIGVFTIYVKKKNFEKSLMYLISFAIGSLLGGAFFHLLPEAIEQLGYTTKLAVLFLSGILVFFFIESLIHWRHFHHSHMFKTPHKKHTPKIKPVAFINLFADGLHNFMDGLIIGFTYLISIPAGIVATLAIVLHEIPQEIGDFGILVHSGFTIKKALLFNVLIGATALIGTIIALIIGNIAPMLILYVAVFTAGGFVYIATADLMPELHVEHNLLKAFLQIFFLILGLVVMYALTFFS